MVRTLYLMIRHKVSCLKLPKGEGGSGLENKIISKWACQVYLNHKKRSFMSEVSRSKGCNFQNQATKQEINKRAHFDQDQASTSRNFSK